MSNTFFLSHSTKDKNLVIEFMNLMRLGMNLAEQDIFCTSQDGIAVGKSYIDVIKKNFNDAKIIIMLISKNYMESPFCLCEMGAAWASDKVMIPILVDVDYKAIEYPATPLKVTQVSEIKNIESLLSIYDDLKNSGYIIARTSSINKQLAIFMNKKLWEYPVENSYIATFSDIEQTEKEIINIIKEKSQRDEAIDRLKPLSDYDLRKFEPQSSNSSK